MKAPIVVAAWLVCLTTRFACAFIKAPDISCTSYKCKAKNHLPVPKSLRFSASGCGTGGISMMNGGMQDHDGDLNKCCNLRTACFSTCGVSYKFCTKEFDKCTAAQCAIVLDTKKKESCQMSANMYKMTLNLGGCSHFETAQADNCNCVVGESRLEEKRTNLLRNFYKKHKREYSKNEEKLSKLVNKHGTNPGKFAKLGWKMVQTYYPKSMDITKSAQDELMDQIRKGNFDFNKDDEDQRREKESAETERYRASAENRREKMRKQKAAFEDGTPPSGEEELVDAEIPVTGDMGDDDVIDLDSD